MLLPTVSVVQSEGPGGRFGMQGLMAQEGFNDQVGVICERIYTIPTTPLRIYFLRQSAPKSVQPKSGPGQIVSDEKMEKCACLQGDKMPVLRGSVRRDNEINYAT